MTVRYGLWSCVRMSGRAGPKALGFPSGWLSGLPSVAGLAWTIQAASLTRAEPRGVGFVRGPPSVHPRGALAVTAERTCAARTRPPFLALTPGSAEGNALGSWGGGRRKTEVYWTSEHGSNQAQEEYVTRCAVKTEMNGGPVSAGSQGSQAPGRGTCRPGGSEPSCRL